MGSIRGPGTRGSARRDICNCRSAGTRRRWRNRRNGYSPAHRDRRLQRRTATPRLRSGEGSGWAAKSLLRDDDAGFFALELGGLGELPAKEFDESARARAAVGAQQAHPVEKNKEMRNF